MKAETIPLAVCADCLCYIANGDIPEDSAQLADIERGIKRETKHGAIIVAGGASESESENGLGFSHRDCDICGGRAGERQRATLILPLPGSAEWIKDNARLPKDDILKLWAQALTQAAEAKEESEKASAEIEALQGKLDALRDTAEDVAAELESTIRPLDLTETQWSFLQTLGMEA